MNRSLVWQRKLLDNSARLLLYPKPSRMTAQISVAVQYGSNDDSDTQAGAAHFLEHMVPGGSAQRIHLSREVERLGGFSDFSTSYEYTLSLADVMPKKLPQASHVVSALFLDNHFDEKQFRSERKIIFHELAEVADDPREKVREMLAHSLFKTHPVKRPIGGSTKTVRQLSLEELTKLYSQYYVPQNIILILSGNLPERALKDAIAGFSRMEGKKVLVREKHGPEVGTPQRKVVKKKKGLKQTYMSVGARTTHSGHPDVPALDLLNLILGAGASSRLFIELREKRALTYDVGSSQTEGSDFGYFSINCAVKQKHVEGVERLIMNELSKLKTEKVSAEELNKGKDMLLGDICRGIDNAESCPELLTFMEIQFGDGKSLLNYINEVKAVTPEDVSDVANKYLQKDRFTTAILAPQI